MGEGKQEFRVSSLKMVEKYGKVQNSGRNLVCI